MDQAYADLAAYVVNAVLEYPGTNPQDYYDRLLKICEDYDKDDEWDAHLKCWDLTYAVAHGLPLNHETEMKLHLELNCISDIMQAGHQLRLWKDDSSAQ